VRLLFWAVWLAVRETPLKRLRFLPQTVGGFCLCVLMLLAMVAVGISAVFAFGGGSPDPAGPPACGNEYMRPGDICFIDDPSGSDSGDYTYDEMLAMEKRDARLARVQQGEARSALPVSVSLMVILGVGMVVAEAVGRRRRDFVWEEQQTNDPLFSLAVKHDWTLWPPDSLPVVGAEFGDPVGMVTGQFDGQAITIQRYTLWTQCIVYLPVDELPEVTIAVDDAGEVMYVGNCGFGERLMTSDVRAAAGRAGIAEFSLVGRTLMQRHAEALVGPRIVATLSGLTALAGTLPTEVLREHGAPVS